MKLQVKVLALLWSLMLVSVLAVPLPALASESSEVESLDIAITKILHMLEGTNPPHVQFAFDITPYSFNYDTSRAGFLPALNSSVVTFTPADVAEAEAEDGIVKHYRQSDKLLQGVSFPCPGYFTYHVSLREDSFQNTKTETMVLDEIVWQLTFCVEYMPESYADVYVSAIDVQQVYKNNTLGPKVDTEELSFVSFFTRNEDSEEPVDEKPPPDGPDDPGNKPGNEPGDRPGSEDPSDNPESNPGSGSSGKGSSEKTPKTGDPGEAGLWLWAAVVSLIISVLTALRLSYHEKGSLFKLGLTQHKVSSS